MKKAFTLTTPALLAAMLCAGNMQAKTVYLSSDGDDSNSGMEATSAKKTLTGIYEIIEANDVIKVSGMIDMDAEYKLASDANDLTKAKGKFYTEGDLGQGNLKHSGFYFRSENNTDKLYNITVEGDDAMSDGFYGDDKWRFFDISNTSVKFSKLSFVNGMAPSEGGAVLIHDNANVTFEDCVFDSNHFDWSKITSTGTESDGAQNKYGDANPTAERGGAIHFQFGTLTLTRCVFTNNNGRLGGCVCQTGGNLVIEDCLFESNGKHDNVDYYLKNTKGGALCIWTLHTMSKATITRTAFIDNEAYNDGGAILFFNSVDTNNGTSNQLDRRIDATIQDCYFAGNTSFREHGGAISIQNNEGKDVIDGSRYNYIKILNSTFYNNTCGFYGAGISIRGGFKGSTFYMVNCTMTGNHGIDRNNGGHGANISFINDKNKTYLNCNNYDSRFINCVFEGNYNSKGEYNDIAFVESAESENIKLVNSAVGRIIGSPDFEALKNAGTASYLQYSTGDAINGILHSEGSKTINGGENNVFGAWAVNQELYSMDEPSIPSADEDALSMADWTVSYNPADKTYDGDPTNENLKESKNYTIRGYDISSADQNGTKRTDANRHVIGAVVSNHNELLTLYGLGGDTDGIESVVAGSDMSIVRNGDVISASEPTARISVYGISGSRVIEATGSADISALDKGIYIVSAIAGSAHDVVKIVK